MWKADLDQSPSVIRSLRSFLSIDERQRAERFYFDRDRNRFIVCHGLLRAILAHYIGTEPDCIQYIYGKNGKPALPKIPYNRDIRFSLSYSSGVCLFAITRSREIGVDIEFSEGSLDFEKIIGNFFTEKERSFFRDLSKYQRKNAFFKLWTKKEALVKALGAGLSLLLNSFDVSLLNREIVKLPPFEGLFEKESKWEVNILNSFSNFKASWAIEV
jgi:4'-phosphopantetheinyl transferase